MEPPEAVAHAATAIEHREMDAARRADLLTTLAIFGRLADRDTDVLAIIGREQMRDSPVIQEFIAEGEALGLRAAVRDVLEIRFGLEAASEFKEALDRIENLEMLSGLFHK
jgi:predicted transposase YdaD